MRRVATPPGDPTFHECGVAGLDNWGGFAVFTPARTPDGVVGYLRNALRATAAEPDMQAKLKDLGLQDAAGTFGKEFETWRDTEASTEAILKKTKIDTNHR